jgi:hypothetical protein
MDSGLWVDYPKGLEELIGSLSLDVYLAEQFETGVSS